MAKAKYEWHAAEVALRNAVRELFAAQRHANARKRVNVLNDLLAAQAEIMKAFEALGPSRSADAVDSVLASSHGTSTREK